MNSLTYARAVNVLQTPILHGNKHVPTVFVVKEKIFVFRHAAEAWRDQVCPTEVIETVSIQKAYGVDKIAWLPRDVKVYTSINARCEKDHAESEHLCTATQYEKIVKREHKLKNL